MAVLNPSSPTEPSGSWDSIHVFETAERGRQAHYKLTSTVMLHMINRSSGAAATVSGSVTGLEKETKNKEGEHDSHEAKRDGEVNLSGSMTRQVRCLHHLMDNDQANV